MTKLAAPNERLNIIVFGYIVRGPLGGLAWHHLHYLLGLQSLGHHVTFLEDSDDYPCCYDPSRGIVDTNPTYGLAFTSQVLSKLGLNRWAYFDAHTGRWHGSVADQIDELCSAADLLLDLSLVNPMRPWTQEIPLRVAVDTDPVFTQIRNIEESEFRRRCDHYHVHFTFAEGIGQSWASIPKDNIDWRPTRQPVKLDQWPHTVIRLGGRFTTIMQWSSYEKRVHDGRHFGMKSDSFAPFIQLPCRTHGSLELALGSGDAPRQELVKAGWALTDPLAVTRDPWTYRDYIQSSFGEFTVAKHAYVTAMTGWFSERSANYLATGRPVITQDTGFSRIFPTGEGLLAFTTLDEAIGCLEEVLRNPKRHAKAARELAIELFDSEKVLSRLLEESFSSVQLSGFGKIA